MTASLEVQRWIETELRSRINDSDFIAKHAVNIVIGIERGDNMQDYLSVFIAAVVLDAAGMNSDETRN